MSEGVVNRLREMTNLQRRPDGSWRWRSGDSGDIVEVEVAYDLGGSNFFTGSTMRRGVYVNVTPKRIEAGMVRTTAFTGGRFFIVPLDRKNARTIDAVAAKLDSAIPMVGACFAGLAEAKSWDPRGKVAADMVWGLIRVAIPVDESAAVGA